MADFRAIAAVTDTILSVLKDNFEKGDFGNQDLQFLPFTAKDFATGTLKTGVSLFMYRIYPNGAARRPPGRVGPDGRRGRPQLPLDLHFLLTAWAPDPLVQHRISGWMMRVMEDVSVLPASLLNASLSDLPAPVFHADESVEVVTAELVNEDLLRLWQDLVQHAYQLSVPYVARNVYVESRQVLDAGAPVQQRGMDYRQMVAS